MWTFSADQSDEVGLTKVTMRKGSADQSDDGVLTKVTMRTMDVVDDQKKLVEQ